MKDRLFINLKLLKESLRAAVASGESAAGQQSGDVFDHEIDEEVTSLVSEHHREHNEQRVQPSWQAADNALGVVTAAGDDDEGDDVWM